MQYYALISVGVILFGLQFLFNQRFEKNCGSTLKASLVFCLGTNIAGFIVLFIVNKFKFEFTLFTLLMAICCALDNLLFIFFSIKALNKINLSLYSVFSMLGGMALPFFCGVVFYDEELTLIHILSFILITIALLFTIKKEDDKKGYIYYAGIFILNGMSGVLAKIFQASNYEKTSSRGFTLLAAAVGIVLTLVILPFFSKTKIKLGVRPVLDMGLYGTVSKIGNLILLISLNHLPASAQYTFVTGGVMVVSTVFALFSKQKPSKKEIISVIIAFAGCLLLVFT